MAQSTVASFPIPERSRHAAKRQRQRCLSDTALDYVLTHGTVIHRTGVTFVFLRRCDVPVADRRMDRLTRLVGTTIVVGEHGRIVTAYRKRNALRDIRRKPKFGHGRRKRGKFQATD